MSNEDKYSVIQIKDALELNFEYFIENTLNLFHRETEEDTYALIKRFVEPYPLLYMFVFINAACTKYSHTEVRDIVGIMSGILQKYFHLSETQALTLVDYALTNAVESTKELTNDIRSTSSIVHHFAEVAGRAFIPGESHKDFLNCFVLIVMSSFSEYEH